MLCVLRHGSTAHKKQLLAEVRGHVAELLVHAEGSAVLQLLYSSVATPAERLGLYRELWGKEFGLNLAGSEQHASLVALFAAEPACQVRRQGCG